MYEAIHDIDDLQKCLIQTWFDLWSGHYRCMLRLTSGVTVRDVHAGGGHFEHMLWNECSFYDSSEHFM